MQYAQEQNTTHNNIYLNMKFKLGKQSLIKNFVECYTHILSIKPSKGLELHYMLNVNVRDSTLLQSSWKEHLHYKVWGE